MEGFSLRSFSNLKIEGAFQHDERQLGPKSAIVGFGRFAGWPFRFLVGALGCHGATK
jgi:hypothetical protein